MRTLVLVDGEHYPPVVAAAIDSLPQHIPGCRVVAAALLGGTEKLRDGDVPEVGVPVVRAEGGPEEALVAGLERHRPALVVDLSDEPVLDARLRMRLVGRCLAAGVRYRTADATFDPPARPRLATKPAVAVIGTGKRTGKTAVSAQLARVLAARHEPPVIVAMGRGGPPDPEVIDPERFDLTPEGLLALADSGRHAASDHLEGALMARVVTIGTRRCGGGFAGAPVDATVGQGVAIANGRDEGLVILEGSGQAIPPVRADATICVVPAGADPELVTGYLGGYRLLLSDLVVITMCEQPLANTGVVTAIERDVRGLAPGAKVVHTVFRPFPLEPITGRRVVYATTAPASAGPALTAHLESEHGCTVVGTSHHLSNRPALTEDLEAAGDAEVLVVELKAAAVDLAVRVALERGMHVVFCDNRAVTVGGDGDLDDLTLGVARTARQRFDDRAHPDLDDHDERQP